MDLAACHLYYLNQILLSCFEHEMSSNQGTKGFSAAQHMFYKGVIFGSKGLLLFACHSILDIDIMKEWLEEFDR